MVSLFCIAFFQSEKRRVKLHVGKIYFASLLTRLFVSSDYFEIIIVWRSQADISISISHGEGAPERQMLYSRANIYFFFCMVCLVRQIKWHIYMIQKSKIYKPQKV